MRNHSDFIQELQKNNWSKPAVAALSNMTNMGVAPEGRGHPLINEVVDILYNRDWDGLLPDLKQGIPFPAPRDPIPDVQPTTFMLGAKSREKNKSLHPQLRWVNEKAITLSAVDFTVFETIRTVEQQRDYVTRGVSRTMKSLHLPQEADGLAHAMDLVHWVDGEPSWKSWDAYAEIAFAVDQAATLLGVAHHIVWGGAWDRRLSDFGGSKQAYLAEVEAYKIRHPGKDFIDGPHFEWRQ